MVTKATRSKFTAKPTVASPAAAPEDILFEQISAAQESYFEATHTISGKRLLVATLTGMCAYAGTLYWTMPVVALASTAVTLLAGEFLGLMVFSIGLVLAIWVAVIALWRTARFVLSFDAAQFLGAAQAMRTKVVTKVSPVRAWFSRSEAAA